jgi:hypothetical protein
MDEKLEKTPKLRKSLITSSTKQIVQGDGTKNLKRHHQAQKRPLSCCHNCQMQDSGGLNSLKTLLRKIS